MPLLTRSGQVRGLFELFSDHAYAFEERDLIALERMAELTVTAIDLSEKRPQPLAPSSIVADSAPSAPVPEVKLNPPPTEAIPGPPETSPQTAPATPPLPPSEGPLGPAGLHAALSEEKSRRHSLPLRFQKRCVEYKNAHPAASPFPKDEGSAWTAKKRDIANRNPQAVPLLSLNSFPRSSRLRRRPTSHGWPTMSICWRCWCSSCLSS